MHHVSFIIVLYKKYIELLSLKYSLFLDNYLERIATANADPISVCEALRQQNDALRQELHDIRRVQL